MLNEKIIFSRGKSFIYMDGFSILYLIIWCFFSFLHSFLSHVFIYCTESLFCFSCFHTIIIIENILQWLGIIYLHKLWEQNISKIKLKFTVNICFLYLLVFVLKPLSDNISIINLRYNFFYISLKLTLKRPPVEWALIVHLGSVPTPTW